MALEDSEFSPDADEGWNADKSEDETVAYGEGDDWGGNDLEAAYRRALEANDAVEWEFNQLPPTNVVSSDDGTEESAAGEQCLENATGKNPDAVAEVLTPPAEIAEPIPQRVTARQVIEAAIFVGGEPLTAKKLCYMLKGDYDLDAVERAIEELNLQYIGEARPYEIRLGEGGYRMVLREEFERIRNRVFGIGPR